MFVRRRVALASLAIVLALLGWGAAADAASPINVCGALSALSPANGTQPARIVIDATTYQLVRPGTITPPDISSRVGNLTHPLVRLTGTTDGTSVTGYQVTQVETCGLPNTATSGERAPETAPAAPSSFSATAPIIGLIAIGALPLLALLAQRRRTRSM